MLMDSQLQEIEERFERAGAAESSIAWVRGSLLSEARAHFNNRAAFADWYTLSLHIDAPYVSKMCLIADNITEPEAHALRWTSKAEVCARLIRDGHDREEVLALGSRLSCSDVKAHFKGEPAPKKPKRLRCPLCGAANLKELFVEE